MNLGRGTRHCLSKHTVHFASGGEEEMEAMMQGMMSDNTQKLTSAVSSLPALLEKKRKIDMHMSMATSVLEQVIS